MIDQWHPDVGVCNTPTPVALPTDERRVARSMDTMRDEASVYAAAAVNALSPQYHGMTVRASLAADGSFKFSDKIELNALQVFYVSPSGLTYAAVNLKPLQPGHVRF